RIARELAVLGRDENAVVAAGERGGNESVGHAKQKTWQPSLARVCAEASGAPLAKSNGVACGRTRLRILSGWRRSKNGQSTIHSAKYR
ncbi:MAG: hypothetical protein ACJ8J3_12860, partial [Burkholderia ambifaria]